MSDYHFPPLLAAAKSRGVGVELHEFLKVFLSKTRVVLRIVQSN